MTRPICIAGIAMLSCLSTQVGYGQNQATKPLTSDTEREAMEDDIQYLKNHQQRRTGTWTRWPSHEGGVTALCTLALLNAGVDPADATIQQALSYLDRLDLRSRRVSVYSVSLTAMAYCLADPEKYQLRIRECVEYLSVTQVAQGNPGTIGGWPYNLNPGRPDASNSQFALLALHEASKVGVESPQRVWRNALEYWKGVWRETGRDSGGFLYSFRSDAPTGSMTCAGISSLIIIDEHLAHQQLPVAGNQVKCCTQDDRIEVVEKASKWIADRFTVRQNPSDGARFFQNNILYFLYGMERAGRLSGQRFFGDHDWYREGAEFLVRRQAPGGSWQGHASHGERDPNIATAFALLFLAKGRRPIVIGKYRHSLDNDWDRHRTGVHYLTRTIEADWGTQLNWQTIEGAHASADDLLEAPVLFISGRDALDLDESQKQNLREYVEYGGFIFAEACQGDGCGDDVQFDKDFKALMAELFPESRLQLLDSNHPVYSSQYPLADNPDALAFRPLYGLQASCRTSVIYCPANLSGFWRLKKPAFWSEIEGRPRSEVDFCAKLGVNVVSYATGRELKDKLDRPTVVSAMEAGLGNRVVLIPKLVHGGGADDAPNAWRNIMSRARVDLQQRFKLERKMIGARFEDLADYPMVFMHGRSRFQWSDEERSDLARYLKNGGFLFADSVCSSNAFVESFRTEMQKMFPGHELKRIPPDHRIWKGSTAPYILSSVSMHKPGDTPGSVTRVQTPPLLEGIEIDGRLVVVFSPHDLSCAMENAAATQCEGYDKDDAARIGVNVIRYAFVPN